LNLFWYRYWYSDKTAQHNIQQDFIFEKLIHTYLFYGLLYPHDVFTHKRFYAKNYLNVKNFKNDVIDQYYRFVDGEKTLFSEASTYRFRRESKQLYFSKLWVFRFQN
jgi:hypothetical protein